jgi:glycosyltransferase involved in cell wall biosynthesis
VRERPLAAELKVRAEGLTPALRSADELLVELASGAADAPLITVAITSYNYGRYIANTVSSALDQDLPHIEVLIVDDASTDDTDAVIAPFLSDPRVRYVKNPANIGVTQNHNRALALARGLCIIFVSSDDMLLPGHLRRCYDYLRAHPTTDIVYTGALLTNADGEPTKVRTVSGQLPVDYGGGRNEFAQQLSEGCYIPIATMLVRRAVYDELGPFDNEFIASDYEIMTRWAAAGKRFAYLRAPSAAIRMHRDQTTGAGFIRSGNDLGDYLSILERYIIPSNFRLVYGYQEAIVAHLRWRCDYYRSVAKADLPAQLAARTTSMVERLNAIEDPLPPIDLGDAPLISVIVRAGTIPQVLSALASLSAQIDPPPWEAVVVSEGGPDLGALLQTLPERERIRYVRTDEANAGAARSLGIRLAAGRIITYLEPGGGYESEHLAMLARAFGNGAEVVRTNAVFMFADGTPDAVTAETVLTGLYPGADDRERELVAPAVPIDCVAHVRRAVQSAGSFRTDLPWGEDWEFWLRLRRFEQAVIETSNVRVWALRSRILPAREAFLGVTRAIYDAYATASETPLARRREAYLATIAHWFENIPGLIEDPAGTAQFLTDYIGIERALPGSSV